MNIGDIVRGTFVQSYLGVICTNVFYWEVGTGTTSTDIVDVGEWFETRVMSEINGFQHDDVSNVRIDLDNITDGLEFGSYNLTGAGILGGAPMPSYVCWGFRLNRASKATRNGYKRFVGVGESDTQGNFVEPSLIPTLELLEPRLSDTATETVTGGDLELIPVIVRLTTMNTVDVVNNISSAEFYGITTQTSRKIDFS